MHISIIVYLKNIEPLKHILFEWFYIENYLDFFNGVDSDSGTVTFLSAFFFFFSLFLGLLSPMLNTSFAYETLKYISKDFMSYV